MNDMRDCQPRPRRTADTEQEKERKIDAEISWRERNNLNQAEPMMKGARQTAMQVLANSDCVAMRTAIHMLGVAPEGQEEDEAKANQRVILHKIIRRAYWAGALETLEALKNGHFKHDHERPLPQHFDDAREKLAAAILAVSKLADR